MKCDEKKNYDKPIHLTIYDLSILYNSTYDNRFNKLNNYLNIFRILQSTYCSTKITILCFYIEQQSTNVSTVSKHLRTKIGFSQKNKNKNVN